MNSRGFSCVVILVLASATAPAAFACTTVWAGSDDRPVVAYNVNKRGTHKRSRFEGGAFWTSRHGSVTFNPFGRDNPTTGINEKGLMISLMWLPTTRAPRTAP